MAEAYQETWRTWGCESYFEGKTDMVILDLGAMIGITTQYLRQYARMVYAVEPSPDHCAALLKTQQYNHWDNVKVFNLAISDTDGTAALFHNEHNSCMDSLVADYGQGGTVVKTQAIDTFLDLHHIEQVDFVKMNIEGAENVVLWSGGFARVAERIKAIRLSLHLENYGELLQHVAELGYTIRRCGSMADRVAFCTRE